MLRERAEDDEARAVGADGVFLEPGERLMRAARDVGEALGEEIEREGRAQVVELMHADAREVEAAALQGLALRADGTWERLLEPALVAEVCHRLMVGEAGDGREMAAAHVEREEDAREQQQEQRCDDE